MTLKAKWKEFMIVIESIVCGAFVFTLIGIITMTILGFILKYYDWLVSVLRL